MFFRDVALGEDQCLFVPSVASMDRQIFVNECSRWVVTCIVMAVFGLYGSLVSLEVSAQCQPATSGPLPPMPIPADNPQNDAKIILGRQLYFDGRLSANNEVRTVPLVTIPKRDGPGMTPRTQELEGVSETAIRELSSTRAT